MCYITRGPLRVVISNISDGGCLIFFEHEFCGCPLKGNVLHVARNVWLGGNETLKGDFSFVF